MDVQNSFFDEKDEESNYTADISFWNAVVKSELWMKMFYRNTWSRVKIFFISLSSLRDNLSWIVFSNPKVAI